jgi:hypothetical protein
MNATIQMLQQHKEARAGQPIAARLGFIKTLIRDFAAVSAEWVEQVTAADLAEKNGHQAIASLLRGEQSRMDFFE